MTAPIVLARRPIEGVRGTVVDPADVAGLTFHAHTDAWTVAGTGGGEYPLVIVDAADAPGLELTVPTLDPRTEPPANLSGPAYLGMLHDGVPNLVVLDTENRAAHRTLGTWLRWMQAEGATRLMSRPPTTEEWLRKGRGRLPRRPDRDAIDLSDAYLRDEGVVAGVATFTVGDTRSEAPVRLSGHLEPIDGRYHWYGLIEDPRIGAALKKAKKGTLEMALAGGTAVPAAVTEKTGWGTYRVSGVGAPPFPI